MLRKAVYIKARTVWTQTANQISEMWNYTTDEERVFRKEVTPQ